MKLIIPSLVDVYENQLDLLKCGKPTASNGLTNFDEIISIVEIFLKTLNDYAPNFDATKWSSFEVDIKNSFNLFLLLKRFYAKQKIELSKISFPN